MDSEDPDPAGPAPNDEGVAAAAVASATRHGRALLKSISANNVGATGSHETGFYLPKGEWRLFAPEGPVKGENRTWDVEVRWWRHGPTASHVKWYGSGTRSEYRLTGFGRAFPYLTEAQIGSLLVLVKTGPATFEAFVADHDDDIEEIQAGLGVEVLGSHAVFEAARAPVAPAPARTVASFAADYAAALVTFPTTRELAARAREAVLAADRGFPARDLDAKLLALVEAEYVLFQEVERRVYALEEARGASPSNLDAFLRRAQSYLQRRKARAGKSLEHHVAAILTEAGVPFSTGPDAEVDGTRPDLLIPGRDAYLDQEHPDDALWMLGLKTTCRDRWRQVLQEAPRLRRRHLLTLQAGVSGAQLRQMQENGVTLVVPRALHDAFAPDDRPRLLTVAKFVETVRDHLRAAR